MMHSQTRFNEFLYSIEDANPKTLSIRLREMVGSGLIERRVYQDEIPVRIEYHLTEKGNRIRSVLEQMAAFSMRYCSEDVFKDKKPRTLRQVFGVPPSILKWITVNSSYQIILVSEMWKLQSFVEHGIP